MKIIAGNWKMNGSKQALKEMTAELNKIDTNNAIILCVPFTMLGTETGKINLGAQDISNHEKGAYTGEISGAMLKEAGAKRTIMLNVSGPFHSPLLVPAGEELLKELEQTELHELRIPYVTNVNTETITDISRSRELLKEQLSSPVRWMQSMEAMIADGVDTFVEIGPGKTLAGFMKKIDKTVKVYNIAELSDIEKVAAELEAVC